MTDAVRLAPALLPPADHALVRTIDALPGAAWAEPSLLPAWTRAHVVAHLTLNAEGLSGVLRGAHLGRPQAMYVSQEARDADIAELADASPAELRERFLAATGGFADALSAMHDDDWDGTFERTPGVTRIRLVTVPLMRLREVEIHHADLAVGYSAADWSPDFCEALLESMTKVERAVSFEVRPTDLQGRWQHGTGGGPVVSGTASALGWWLTGRGSGEGLTSDTGELPAIGAW